MPKGCWGSHGAAAAQGLENGRVLSKPQGAKSWDSLYGSSWIWAVSGTSVSTVGFWWGDLKVAGRCHGDELRPALRLTASSPGTSLHDKAV